MSVNNNPTTAADVIRQKLADLYKVAPDAKKELEEAKADEHRSKHQAYMYELSSSGKSLAEIQTAWHSYYQALSNDEKHEVWNEFYRQYDQQRVTPEVVKTASNPIYEQIKPRVVPARIEPREPSPEPPKRPITVAQLKEQLFKGVAAGKKLKKASKKEHLKSLGFGLACGFVAIIIFLFSFFNERFIAPFITPSKNISNAPIIIDSATGPAGPEPMITIPKINVQIPVVYTEPSIDEKAVQKALESGVLHYATTPNPGELGNGVIFGHSSNNIFNSGKYKFAFVLLNRLEAGDTFTLQKDGKRYVYKVYEKKVVSPNDLSVLGAQGNRPATMALVTCDPPGTTINRLVVFGEQITPDPLANVASTAAPTQTPVILPSDAPSLWSRIWGWLSS